MTRTGRRKWIFISGQCALLKKNAYCIHLSSGKDANILMAYIVDLICVMQVIFLLASGRGDPVKPAIVFHALRAYETPRKVVHLCVDEFDGKLGVRPGGRQLVLDKIEALIWRYSIPDDKVEELRRKIGEVLSGSS